MDEPARGMIVIGPSGQLGTVDDVIYENTGEAARVMVRQESGQSMVLQPGTYQVEHGMLRIGSGGAGAQAEQNLVGPSGQPVGDDLYRTQQVSTAGGEDFYRTQELGTAGSVETREVRAGEAAIIPVIREELRVARREIERGGVRVHKRVEEREEVVEEPAYREEVTVERVPLGQPIDEEIGSRQEGDTLIIPVLEEMLVVEKRLVLKEEVRITKRRIEETEQARIVLREEHVDIEELGGSEPVA